MWIVAVDETYYPLVNEYETYEEAKRAFDNAESNCCDKASVYLAEIKDRREIEGSLYE